MNDRPALANSGVFGVRPDVPFEELVAVSDEQQAHRRVADAIRVLMRRLGSTSASIEQLDATTAALGELTDALARHDEGEGGTDPLQQIHRLRERSPFIGRANAIALPLEIRFVEEGVEATATFDFQHEGPPGCLHGGYIAGIFDEVLGAAQTWSGQAGMTGRLTVHYRSPTPLYTELTIRARLDRVDGRKVVCRGSIHAGERLCAEAEGLFIVIDPAKAQQLLEQFDAQQDDRRR